MDPIITTIVCFISGLIIGVIVSRVHRKFKLISKKDDFGGDENGNEKVQSDEH
jgi:hypothetical protein